MNSWALVSGQIIIEVILDRISQPDCNPSFLFYGWLRTVGQAGLFCANHIEFRHVLEI